LTSINPTMALANESVVITGNNFTGATMVRFGSASTTTFSVDSDTQITVTVPATGVTGKVSVVTPSGTGLSKTDFIVIKPPTISSFTPASGKANITLVTIMGTNLSSVTDVKFNGISVT